MSWPASSLHQRTEHRLWRHYATGILAEDRAIREETGRAEAGRGTAHDADRLDAIGNDSTWIVTRVRDALRTRDTLRAGPCAADLCGDLRTLRLLGDVLRATTRPRGNRRVARSSSNTAR